ncbi:MAG: hypothetical protein E4H08_07815 [Candidatus Atribacteria bacterium]|nr:MAG: hypothetical protein E4H08_07815 [Candidatus Atribacteria bacterium]
MKANRMWMCLAVSVVMLAPAAWGLSLCSYQTPETLLMDAGTSFSYQYFDDANTPAIDVSTGRIDFSFSRLRDTAIYGSTVRLNGQVGLTNFLPSRWMGEADASFRYYVSKDLPLFGFGGVHGITTTGQTQLGLDIQSGFGFGRFKDVSPLAKAMLIHQTLRSNRAIGGPLPDSVVLSIGQAIGGLSVENPVENVVATIESLVEIASGVQLDARSLLMIEDVVANTEPQRFCGFSAQAGLGYELLDPYGGPQGFLVALSADAAYAPDPSGQMQGHLGFSGPFDIADENTLTGSFSYEILLAGSSSLEAGYTFQRVKLAGLSPTTSHGISCNVVFKLSSIDVLVGLSFVRSTGDPGWSVGCSISASMDLL